MCQITGTLGISVWQVRVLWGGLAHICVNVCREVCKSEMKQGFSVVVLCNSVYCPVNGVKSVMDKCWMQLLDKIILPWCCDLNVQQNPHSVFSLHPGLVNTLVWFGRQWNLIK